MDIKIDPLQTDIRRLELYEYFAQNVMNSCLLICERFTECRASHSGNFYEGQLPHVGRFYDMFVEEVPFKIIIVGQEYGHGPPRVSLDARYKMIMSSGLECRFKANGSYEARNPHMKGTTSVLRLLFNMPLGIDHENEFLTTDDGVSFHVFDAFALVNYLLCSAVPIDNTRRGMATPKMKVNCRRHFRRAMEILEPNIIIVQGKSFWLTIMKVFDDVHLIADNLYRVSIERNQAYLATFSHPAARYPYNWGTNARTPYLLDTVSPVVKKIREELFRESSV